MLLFTLNNKLSIYIVSVLSFSVYGQSSFPKFSNIPSGTDVVEYKISPPSKKHENWYASWPSFYRLVLYGYKNITLHMNCGVNKLRDEDALSEITFCFQIMTEGLNCKTLKPDMPDARINFFHKHPQTTSLTFNVQNGGSAKIELADPKKLISFKFYCKVKNRHAIVASNTLQVVDYRKEFPSVLKEVDEPKHSLNIHDPALFPCVSHDVPDHVPVEWSLSPASRISSMAKRNLINPKQFWPLQILQNGSLYFPFISPQVHEALEDQYLMCEVANIKAVLYTRPLKISRKNSSKNQIKKLRIINPAPNGVRVTLLNASTVYVTKSCNFESGEGTATLKWIKYDKFQNDQGTVLHEGINKPFKVSVKSDSVIEFVGPFTAATEGLYVCEIVWKSKSGGYENRSSWYNVSVSSFPKFAIRIPDMKYVPAGYNGSVDCGFTDSDVQVSLEVNGYTINIKDHISLLDSINRINQIYKKVMLPLQGLIHPFNPVPGSLVKYTSLTMDTGPPSSDHQVDCIGTNKLGRTRKTILLKVIPKLKVEFFVAVTKKSVEEYVINCNVKNAMDYNQSNARVLIHQYWKINNVLVEFYRNDFVKIENKNQTLRVNAHLYSRLFKVIESDYSHVDCIITLQYPPDMITPNDLFIGPYNTEVFYNSENDSTLNSQLSIPLKLQYNSSLPTTEAKKKKVLIHMLIMGLFLLAIFIASLSIIAVVLYTIYRRRLENARRQQQQQSGLPRRQSDFRDFMWA